MAHLFEHLMFGGSRNAPSYDEPLQKASGENNAFTSNDLTNYYVTLPAENIETALWLESDRMFQLDISQRALDVQKGVVMEEFKQRYLNQPYGDIWLHFRPLVYKKHPYQWATIGKELSHIEKVTIDNLQGFYSRFYNPSNAILVIAGNIGLTETRQLVEKWFSDIPRGKSNPNEYVQEEKQEEPRYLRVEKDVPLNSLSFGFHCGPRHSESFYSLDLLGDILGGSLSSRLQQELVRERKLFTDIGAYSTESLDNGLFIISGRLFPEVSESEANEAVWQILNRLAQEPVSEKEWSKVLNKKLTVLKFNETEVLNKAMHLAMYTNMGDTSLINKEESLYRNTSPESIQELAQKVFTKNNASILYYGN